MDQNLIYIKTAAGEEAVRQRTRVVQRNTRMVLILVDGSCSVGELCEKAGNIQLVETALQELERDGLIVPKLEQDSVWEQSRKLAEEIKAAAVNRLARDMPKEAPIIAPQAPSAIAPEPFSVASVSVAPFSTFGGQMPSSMAPFSTFGTPPPVSTPQETSPVLPEKKEAAGFFGRLFTRTSRADKDDSIGPIRRGGSKTYISLPLALTLALVGVLAILMAVFLLYPYGSHKPGVEEALSRLAGQSLRVGGLQAELMPKPGIILSNISSSDGSGDIQIARIRLLPEFFSLLGARPVFSMAEISGARMAVNAIAVMPKAMVAATSGDAAFTVRSARFSDLTLDILGLALTNLQCEIVQSEKGGIGPLTFNSADRSFKAVLQAQDRGFVADIEALGWKPSEESRFLFDSLHGQVIWDGLQVVVRSLDARIFDGTIQGVLMADMQGGRPGVAGDLTIKRMNLMRLAGAFGHGKQFEGDIAASLRFGARGTSWGEVLSAASGEGTMTLSRGALGFDLVEAVRRGGTPVKGGTTRYEQLNTGVRVSPEGIHFTDLALASGLLRANGAIDLMPDARLSGKLDVEMRGSANMVRMPVLISGSLKDPVLQGRR